MKLKIHRGGGVVEYNLVEIATETTKIILDCGRNLPLLDNDPIEEAIDVPGLTSGASAYGAVIVTHHYADHADFIERVNSDIPIFMNADTKIILDVVADFSDSPLPRVDKFMEHGNPEKIGDIRVLPISVDRRVAGKMIPLKPRDYSYRKQFEAAKEQLKPKTLISVQRIGMVASARHGKTIEIYDGDAEILI